MSEVGTLGRPARILLVEDNPDDIELTRLAFSQIDIEHELYIASDGFQAISFLKREDAFTDALRPDLILLDLNMPGKDGRDVLKEVKEDPSLRRIPVIVLTTSDAGADRLLTYSRHVNAYLTKPMDMEEWDAVVQAFADFWLRFVRYPPTDSKRGP
ncbi:MAG: response regulator [Pirellulaceae bacterium]